MDEEARVERLRALFEQSDPRVSLGIGDDAAVLDDGFVISVDASVEGTHFRRTFADWTTLARRAVVAALSDLAAMGAQPTAVLTSMTLPADVDDLALHRGVLDAAQSVDAVVIGGNLASGPHVEVHTTVIGRADAPLRRDGANAGEGVFVTGPTGSAALGLHGLLHDAPNAFSPAWLLPRAHIAEGVSLRNVATACVDVSDGLLRDLHHLCSASGVGAEIDSTALPYAEGFEDEARRHELDPAALSLSGGEAYVLLFTAEDPPIGTRIGTITEAAGVRVDGANHLPQGFDHFAP